MSQRIRVLLADDHPVIRQGLRVLLSTEPDIEIVGESEDGQKAVELAARTKPHVVVMDVAMAGADGVHATRRILNMQPNCKVLALSTYTDEEAIRRMFEAGAFGYVTKKAAADELIKAIRQALSGSLYCSRDVAPTVKRLRDAGDSNPSWQGALTPRERQAVELITEGLTSREVAMRLGLTLAQLKYCRERAMHKLNIHNIADLTRFALEHGWVTLLNQRPTGAAVTPKKQRLTCSLVSRQPAPPLPNASAGANGHRAAA